MFSGEKKGKRRMGMREVDPLSQLSLPPGFRFYPTDEELLIQYLCRKVAGHNFPLQIIGDIDLYKFDPWDLPSKAIFGEKEWYFFSPRDRKYPNGSRPNRVAASGYWKATGTDKIITNQGKKVGIKKALVFYVGKAPKGTKTNWIMHEYRLSESPRKNGSTRLDDWVLCRIYKKNSSGEKPAAVISGVQTKEYSLGSSSSSSSQYDDVLESLPEIDDRIFSLPRMNSIKNLQQLGSGNFDWANLAGLSPLPEPGQAQLDQHPPPHMNMVGQDDIYASGALHHLVGKPTEEEVQSGIRSQRLDRSGFYPETNPFGSRYPAQIGEGGLGSGYRL